MTPTQADHEAAARIDRMMTEERCEGASPAHIGANVWRIHCSACRQALVRAALSEAVRVAVEKDESVMLRIKKALRLRPDATLGYCDKCDRFMVLYRCPRRGTPPETGEKEKGR